MPGKFAIGWTQVAVCFVLLAAISMIASSFGLVAVPLEKEFGVSRKVLMLALTGGSGSDEPEEDEPGVSLGASFMRAMSWAVAPVEA